MDHLRSPQGAPGEWLRDPNGIPGLSGQGREALTKLSAALNCFDQGSEPWTVLATLLLDRTRIAAGIADSADVADQISGCAIWQLMNFIRVQPSGSRLPIVRLLDRVRQLVRLGDDRDLRQLPTAAQGIDAVRLMTIHGAKGLEFPVVHVPGLNTDTLPRRPVVSQCPPPDGMVEGGEDNALETFRTSHAEEQECLFYVALSRARDRLFIYAPTKKSNGHNRSLSPFLDRLGPGLMRRHIHPMRCLPPTPDAADVELVIKGDMSFHGTQIALYESCPRRFFYTHILQIKGRRTATAFMRMHEAVRTVFQAVIDDDEPITGDLDLEQRVVDALTARGLAEHGYFSDYRALALEMVSYFVSIREGYTPEVPTALYLKFGDEPDHRPPRRCPSAAGRRPNASASSNRPITGRQKARMSEQPPSCWQPSKRFPMLLSNLSTCPIRRCDRLPCRPESFRLGETNLWIFLKKFGSAAFPRPHRRARVLAVRLFFICGPTPPGTPAEKFLKNFSGCPSAQRLFL